MVVDRELKKLLISITEEEEYGEESDLVDQANERRPYPSQAKGSTTEPRRRHSRTKTGG